MAEPVTLREFLIGQGADERDVDLLSRQGGVRPDPQIPVIYVSERSLRVALTAADSSEQFREAAARLRALLPAGGLERPAARELAARLAGGVAGDAGADRRSERPQGGRHAVSIWKEGLREKIRAGHALLFLVLDKHTHRNRAFDGDRELSGMRLDSDEAVPAVRALHDLLETMDGKAAFYPEFEPKLKEVWAILGRSLAAIGGIPQMIPEGTPPARVIEIKVSSRQHLVYDSALALANLAQEFHISLPQVGPLLAQDNAPPSLPAAFVVEPVAPRASAGEPLRHGLGGSTPPLTGPRALAVLLGRGPRVDHHGKIVALKPESDRALVTGAHTVRDRQGETTSLNVRDRLQIEMPLAWPRLVGELGFDPRGIVDADDFAWSDSGLVSEPRAIALPETSVVDHDEPRKRGWPIKGVKISEGAVPEARIEKPADEGRTWRDELLAERGNLAYEMQDGTLVIAWNGGTGLGNNVAWWGKKDLGGAHAFLIVKPGDNTLYRYKRQDVAFEVNQHLRVWAMRESDADDASLGHVIEYPDGTRVGYSGLQKLSPALFDFYLEAMDVDALYLDIRAMGLRKNGSPDNVHGDPTDRAFTDYFDAHPELLDRIIAIDYDRPDLPLIEQLPFINARTGDRLFLEGPGREIVVKRVFNADTVSSFNSDGTSWEVRRNADHIQVTSQLGQVTEAIINARIEVMMNGALLAALPVEAAPDNSPEMAVQTLFASGRALVGDDHLLLVDLVRVMRKQGTKLSDEQELAIKRLLARAPRDTRPTRALLARQRGVGHPKGVNLIAADGEKGRLVTLAARPENHNARVPTDFASVDGPGRRIFGTSGIMTISVLEARLRAEIPHFDALTRQERNYLIWNANKERDDQGHIKPGAIAKMVQDLYLRGSIRTPNEKRIGNDLVATPSRGGVMVKTSQGWIQIGVPMWTNKDAFLRFLKANGFTLAKEDIPKHVAVTYIDDPEYSGHLNGKLPFDFLGYMFFVTKGTQFTLVAQSKEQADELKRFLDLSYKGQRAADLSASVVAEFPAGAVGVPDMLAEMTRGYDSPEAEALRRVLSFDEQTGNFQMGDVVVRRLGNQRYEIIDRGASLGVVDLKEHPIPKPDLSRKLKTMIDEEFQKVRYEALVQGKPGVWPIGTGHGFDVAGETSGFMIWNNGRIVLVDPPSITLEYLMANGIPLDLIDGVIITHGHSDHYGNSIPQLIEALPRIKLYTTKTIYNMLREQYKAALGNDDLTQWEFAEVKPQKRTIINGLEFEFDYSFHPVPALSFEIWNSVRTTTGEGSQLIFYFSGDTYAAPDILERLTKPSADGEPAVMSVERAFRILRHYFYLPLAAGKSPEEVVALFRKDDSPIKIPDEYVDQLTTFLHGIRASLPEQWTTPQFLIEGGIPPIHIPPELTAKYLKFMEGNEIDVSRFHVYHIADQMAKDKGVPKWVAGHKGWIDLTEYFSGDQWRELERDVVVDRALKRVPPLEGLTEADRATLVGKAKLERFEPGEVIFKAGQYAGDKFYVILDGEVKITVGGTIGFKRQSGLIGEAGFLGDDNRRNATVRATIPTVLLEFSVKELRGLFEEKGVVAALTKIRENRRHAYTAFAKSPWAELPQEIVTSLLMIGEIEEMTEATSESDKGFLVREGANTRDVYIILEGKAQVVKEGLEGVIASLGVGDMVGEMALVRNAPRSASVLRKEGEEKLKVIRFPADKLEALMEKYPGIGAALRRLTREREAADAKRGNGGGEASPAPSSATPVASPAAAPAGPVVPPVQETPPAAESRSLRIVRDEPTERPSLSAIQRSAVSWALSLGLRDTARFIAGLSSRNLERLILVGDQKWSLILKRRGFAEEAAQIAVVASRLVERDRVLLSIAAMGGSRADVQKMSARVLQSRGAIPGSAHDFSGRSSAVFGAPGLGSGVFRNVPIH